MEPRRRTRTTDHQLGLFKNRPVRAPDIPAEILDPGRVVDQALEGLPTLHSVPYDGAQRLVFPRIILELPA